MKLKFLILILIFVVCFKSFSQKTYVMVSNYYNYPIHYQSELKKKVLYNGDTIAYEVLKMIYLDTFELREDFFVYALNMAKLYNYIQAYYDVFTCFIDFYPYKGGNMDNESATMAIDFLLDAAERGHQQAQYLVKKYDIMRCKKNKSKYIKQIIKGEGFPLYW